MREWEDEGRGVEEVGVRVGGGGGVVVEEGDWKVLEGSRSVGGAAEGDGAGEVVEGLAGDGNVGELLMG